jgi:hypothetical protein
LLQELTAGVLRFVLISHNFNDLTVVFTLCLKDGYGILRELALILLPAKASSCIEDS